MTKRRTDRQTEEADRQTGKTTYLDLMGITPTEEVLGFFISGEKKKKKSTTLSY